MHLFRARTKKFTQSIHFKEFFIALDRPNESPNELA